jgi:hypothetical protein
MHTSNCQTVEQMDQLETLVTRYVQVMENYDAGFPITNPDHPHHEDWISATKLLNDLADMRLQKGAPEGVEIGEFKPCVLYYEDMRITEMLLREASIVWCPWGPYKGHAVYCGYDMATGELVGIKIWDDVRKRLPPAPAPASAGVDDAELITRLRSPLPVCQFDSRSPDYLTDNPGPCRVCGGTEDGPDKCKGADTSCMGEAAARIEALLSHTAALEQRQDDFRWLIEAPGPRYLGVRHLTGVHTYDFVWVEDHNAALAFKTQEQADLTMMAVRQMNRDLFAFAATLGDARPVEHGWMAERDTALAPPTAQGGE